jgi:predicted small lipoprotein YifL
MKTVSRWALSCATLLALSACGNKGPLVLPEKPAPVAAPAPAAPTPASTDPSQPAAVGEQSATPPVQIKPEAGTTAPTSDDAAADKAVDEGGADGDG